MNRKYHAGMQFGKWTVIETHPDKLTVICGCGTIRTTKTSNITSGRSQGCPKCKPPQSNKKAGNVVSMTSAYGNAKASAKRRKKDWSLSKEAFFHLVVKPCHYCGDEPNRIYQTRDSEPFVCHGLDRYDSTRGYDTGNVLTCCKYCNRMKSDLTYDEFTARIAKIAERHTPDSVCILQEAYRG